VGNCQAPCSEARNAEYARHAFPTTCALVNMKTTLCGGRRHAKRRTRGGPDFPQWLIPNRKDWFHRFLPLPISTTPFMPATHNAQKYEITPKHHGVNDRNYQTIACECVPILTLMLTPTQTGAVGAVGKEFFFRSQGGALSMTRPCKG
jgi:hypothetical protein